MLSTESQLKVELDKVLIKRFKLACKAHRPRTNMKAVLEMFILEWTEKVEATQAQQSETTTEAGGEAKPQRAWTKGRGVNPRTIFGRHSRKEKGKENLGGAGA